jgi:hypothetical protein
MKVDTEKDEGWELRIHQKYKVSKKGKNQQRRPRRNARKIRKTDEKSISRTNMADPLYQVSSERRLMDVQGGGLGN